MSPINDFAGNTKLYELVAADAEVFNVIIAQHIDEHRIAHEVLTNKAQANENSAIDEHDDNHGSEHDHD